MGNCITTHNTSLIVFDTEEDKTYLQCKDCGGLVDDPNTVNQALLIVLQHRFRDMFYDPLPSQDRPEAN